MKKALAIVVLATSAFAFANDPGKKAEMKAKVAEHKAAVEQACASDAEKAGCSGKEIGSGLMKCIHAYKKANKGFELSESCKASAKSLRDEKKEWKAKKAAEKAEREEEKADK